MDAARCTVTTPEALLIHAPILLFAIPLPALIGLAVLGAFPTRVICLLLAWWCASGTTMMCLDSGERRGRYLRLVRVAARRPTHPDGHGQTLCGWFLLQALRYRERAALRSARRKESKHE